MDKWDAYAEPATGATETADKTDKWAKFAEAPTGPEREEVEAQGSRWTGQPEAVRQAKKFQAEGVPFEPEKLGLSVEGPMHTGYDTAKTISQFPARMAAPAVGLMTGGIPGGIAASAGLEGLLNKAGVGEEGESLGQAVGRGGVEGAVMGLLGPVGKAGGAVGKAALGKVGLGAIGKVAGSTAGQAELLALSKGHAVPDAEDIAVAGLTEAGGAALRPLGRRLMPGENKLSVAGGAEALGKKMERPYKLEQNAENVRRGRSDVEIAAAEEGRAQKALKPLKESTKQEIADAEAAARAETGAYEDVGRVEKQRVKGALEPIEERVRRSQAELAGATTERQAAKMESQAALEARTRGAAADVEQAVAQGRTRVKEVLGEQFSDKTTTTKTTTKTTGAGGGAEVPHEVPHPAYGWTAKELHESPEVVHIMKGTLGEEMVPTKVELNWAGDELDPALAQRGSYSMESRLNRWNALAKNNPAEATQRLGRYAEKLSQYMLGKPEYAALPAEEMQAVARAASGSPDLKTVEKVMQVFSTKTTGRMISPRLKIANKAYEGSKLKAYRATEMKKKVATYPGVEAANAPAAPFEAPSLRRATAARERLAASPEQTAAQGAMENLAGKQQTLRERLEAQAKYDPTREGRNTLPNMIQRHLQRGAVGAVLGGSFGGVPGMVAGAALAPFGHKILIKGMAKVGDYIQRAATSTGVVRTLMDRVATAGQQRGEHAASAMLFILARQEPELRKWIGGEQR